VGARFFSLRELTQSVFPFSFLFSFFFRENLFFFLLAGANGQVLGVFFFSKITTGNTSPLWVSELYYISVPPFNLDATEGDLSTPPF